LQAVNFFGIAEWRCEKILDTLSSQVLPTAPQIHLAVVAVQAAHGATSLYAGGW